ncbi:transcription intermediary factor 1-alpha-like [Babylonia areolata]|uniref:transcription intermediary factor 1-alpha-like n=1 Tax=Babylonia areolata TaxID=304850 RepID=UPI003FD0A369
MAASEGGRRTEHGKPEDDFRESCALCMELYVGRTPKILPCFHTFCLPCLTALAESAAATETSGMTVCEAGEKEERGTEETESEDDEADRNAQPENREDGGGERQGEEGRGGEEGGEEEGVKEEGGEAGGGVAPSRPADGTAGAVFLCPTCRAAVTVPDGGVAVLQTNFYIVAKAVEAIKPLPCEVCEEEDRKEAAYSCDKCQQRMCGTCRQLHDKFGKTKKHQVRPLSPQRKASSRKETVKKCKVHQDHDLCLFCTDCDVMICLVCKLTSHQPHETEDVGAAAVRGKEELSALVKRAREQVFVTNKLRSRLSRDVQELHRQRKEASEEVRARHDMVLAWVSRAQEELLEAISADSETALAQLEMEDTAASNAIETLSRLLARAAVSTTDSAETLLLKVELNAAVAAREKLEELKKESERAEQRRFLTVKSDSSAVDLGDVRAFLGELSVGHTGDAPSVSLRDQIQALEAKIEAVETSHCQLDTRVGGVESKMNTTVGFQATLNDGINLPKHKTATRTTRPLAFSRSLCPACIHSRHLSRHRQIVPFFLLLT